MAVTLSSVLASSVTQLAILGFIAGLGIGVPPISFALNVEYVPQAAAPLPIVAIGGVRTFRPLL
ncbi:MULTISPECIES: hypothetical protein [Rhodopseudomonas]|uniref:hypothetical protein n=1 Tax=Rhodopseudomonas TaxID=1073 RepID=UPI00128BD9B9|nr:MULTISPECIES: hypothetical protein [Rhodopseudomonas]MDF3808860.1 hypothetical protein [Rhodopseudomonas sp. BAL398]WOK19841.1 hypothetical protein RBJ75_10115 [Rhodopseudomonas sp. BAL398]